MVKKFELGRLMCTVILGTSFLTGSAYAEENLSEFVLDGINVTALGYEKSNLDTPVDTVVYTGEQLKETGSGMSVEYSRKDSSCEGIGSFGSRRD